MTTSASTGDDAASDANGGDATTDARDAGRRRAGGGRRAERPRCCARRRHLRRVSARSTPEFLREKLSKPRGPVAVQIRRHGGHYRRALHRGLSRLRAPIPHRRIPGARFHRQPSTPYATRRQPPSRPGPAPTGSSSSCRATTTPSARCVPGADDDGSGVVGALATAKRVAGLPDSTTGCASSPSIEEEAGARGSKSVRQPAAIQRSRAQRLDRRRFSSRWLGYHTKDDGGFLLVDCSSSKGIARRASFSMTPCSPPSRAVHLALEPHDACITSSDHGTFWTAAKPAVAFSEEFSLFRRQRQPLLPQRMRHGRASSTSTTLAKMATLSVLVTADLVGAR